MRGDEPMGLPPLLHLQRGLRGRLREVRPHSRIDGASRSTGGVAHRDYLFRHDGDVFSDATPETVRMLPASHGASWADVDADGDLDLALAGTTAEQMPLLLRNRLPPATAARSLKIRVLDGSGRGSRAGAEVRVFRAGTTRLLSIGLVDAGSGYNSQSDLPVHIGVGSATRVDVQVIFPAAGKRTATWRRNVSPASAAPILIRTR